jgi:hypothetical protein
MSLNTWIFNTIVRIWSVGFHTRLASDHTICSKLIPKFFALQVIDYLRVAFYCVLESDAWYFATPFFVAQYEAIAVFLFTAAIYHNFAFVRSVFSVNAVYLIPGTSKRAFLLRRDSFYLSDVSGWYMQ